MSNRSKRYEINRAVNRILSRHAVDLTRLTFSTTGYSVFFSGVLTRQPQGEFQAQELLALLRDLAATPYRLQLQFDLHNWDIGTEAGAWRVKPLREVAFKEKGRVREDLTIRNDMVYSMVQQYRDKVLKDEDGDAASDAPPPPGKPF